MAHSSNPSLHKSREKNIHPSNLPPITEGLPDGAFQMFCVNRTQIVGDFNFASDRALKTTFPTGGLNFDQILSVFHLWLRFANSCISVAEHYPPVGVATNKVAGALICPSLCDESVTWIDHSGETGPELPKACGISVTAAVENSSCCVPIGAQTMQDGSGKTSHFGKTWVQVQRV